MQVLTDADGNILATSEVRPWEGPPAIPEPAEDEALEELEVPDHFVRFTGSELLEHARKLMRETRQK